MSFDKEIKFIDTVTLDDLKNALYSVYEYDAYTLNEILCKFYYGIKANTELCNNVAELANWVLNEGLSEEVTEQLLVWYEDGTLEEIINEGIFSDINNRIDETYNSIDSVDKSLTVVSNKFNYETDMIYQFDDLSLSGTQTWSYYDYNSQPWYYPQVGMNKEGQLIFRGEARIDTSQPLVFDEDGSGMVHLASIYHFSINAHEGIPLRGYFVGVNDNDFNDTIMLPFMVRPNGKIYVKNIEDTKYYSRIDLTSGIASLHYHGDEIIMNNINEACERVLSRDCTTRFIRFTDLHASFLNPFAYRRYKTLQAINYASNYIDATCIINNGDTINDTARKDFAINIHKEVASSFGKDKYIYSHGNHDINIDISPSAMIYPYEIKPYFNNSNTVFGGIDKNYSYTDYPLKKLRVISFDTFENDYSGISPSAGVYVSESQLQWIKENAMNMTGKLDWNVVAVGHVAPTPMQVEIDTVLQNNAEIRQLLEDFKYGTGDFASQGSIKFVGYLGGHEHCDRKVIMNGITYFTSLLTWSVQVGYQNPNEEYQVLTREFGTDYELCFDIISIDNNTRQLIIDRVGRSSSHGKTIIIGF